jgi:hypothetical protein
LITARKRSFSILATRTSPFLAVCLPPDFLAEPLDGEMDSRGLGISNFFGVGQDYSDVTANQGFDFRYATE